MLISTEIGSAAKFIGEEKAVEYVAKAGFDAWDFSMFRMAKYDWLNKCILPNEHPLAGNEYLSFARKLRKIGEDNGIHCNQSHAPFPIYCKDIRDMYKRAIECTAEAGGKICVIHPDNYKGAAENAEMYLEMLPFAKQHGVKIAAENMWFWDEERKCAYDAACSHHTDFLKHIETVGDEYFVACLDIGHAEMNGLNTSSVEMIETLGSHLQALHIHDNDLIHDSHQIPFSMKIDFKAICEALKRIGYTGYLTLESDAYLKSADGIFENICLLAESAKKLNELTK